jgi:hypothetical protein
MRSRRTSPPCRADWEDEALHHRVRFQDVRRAGLRRFSDYGLFYVVRGSDVIIFAISHGARNPAWVRRKRSHLG